MADVWMLEDMPERAELLAELTGVEPARSSDVMSALRSRAFVGARVWMLDHDLCRSPVGGRCPTPFGMYANPHGCRCPDGRAFIRQVAHEGVPWPEAVIVHSANVSARKAMVDMLNDAGCPRVCLLPVERWRLDVVALKSIVCDWTIREVG